MRRTPLPPAAMATDAERLFEAMNTGDAEEVRRVIDAGVDPNAKDDSGVTVLYSTSQAAGLNAMDMRFVEVLLEKGADPNLANDVEDWRYPPLFHVVSPQHLDVVKLLLEHDDIDVNAKYENDTGPLHWAIAPDRLPMVKLLLQKGADVNARHYLGYTVLHKAADWGLLEFVELLVAHGADVNAKSDSGDTVLFCTVESATSPSRQTIDDPMFSYPDVVELLLKKGADVHAENNDGFSALLVAVERGDVSFVERLLKAGDVNAKNRNGDTALHIALQFGQREMAHRLLERGAVAVIANNKRRTPLHLALQPQDGEPDVELIRKMLLPSGALVRLAKDAVDAHEKRQKRIKVGLEGAARRQSPALEELADTLAGVGASRCAPGTGVRLVALLRRLAYPKAGGNGAGAEEAFQALKRRRLGDAYTERRRRHRLAVRPAMQSSDFISELAEALAGVNLHDPNPGATKGLAAAAVKLDAIAGEGA